MVERLSRQEQRERTRTQLIDSAMQLFAERGIASVSLEQVAASVGMTKGAIYTNFASRDDLVMAVMERHGHVPEIQFPAEQPLADASTGGGDRFTVIGGLYADSIKKRRLFALFYLEFWLYALRNPQARDLFVERLEKGLAGWTDSAITIPPQGLTPRSLGRLVAAVDLGIGLQHLLDATRFDAELYGDALRLILAPGATKPPAS
jgi:AcrR family transcriptional regulator